MTLRTWVNRERKEEFRDINLGGVEGKWLPKYKRIRDLNMHSDYKIIAHYPPQSPVRFPLFPINHNHLRTWCLSESSLSMVMLFQRWLLVSLDIQLLPCLIYFSSMISLFLRLLVICHPSTNLSFNSIVPLCKFRNRQRTIYPKFLLPFVIDNK